MSTTSSEILDYLGAAGHSLRPVQLRWTIWGEQQRAGHQPCFGTERRMFCEELRCPWRGDCLSLRAEWRR